MLFNTHAIESPKNYDEMKEYAQPYLVAGHPIPPMLTCFKHKRKVISVQFPAVEDSSGRKSQFKEVGFVPTVLSCDYSQFIIDSRIPMNIVNDSAPADEYVDALLVLYCNEIGAWLKPLPYVVNEDSNVDWTDSAEVTHKKDFINNQSDLLAFSAQQFFFSSDTLYWKGVLSYLYERNYTITFHEPYSAENIGLNLHGTI